MFCLSAEFAGLNLLMKKKKKNTKLMSSFCLCLDRMILIFSVQSMRLMSRVSPKTSTT